MKVVVVGAEFELGNVGVRTVHRYRLSVENPGQKEDKDQERRDAKMFHVSSPTARSGWQSRRVEWDLRCR